MTELLDRPIAGASTMYPVRAGAVASLQAAEDFYLQGPRPTRQIAIQVGGLDGSLRRTWVATHMEQRVNELLQLRPGWDGRGAQPPTDEAVEATIGVLFAVTDDLSLPPQVFPLPDGGLQLEWHAGASVEIEVDGEGSAHVLATDEVGRIVLNGEMEPVDETLLGIVRDTIHHLTVRLARAR